MAKVGGGGDFGVFDGARGDNAGKAELFSFGDAARGGAGGTDFATEADFTEDDGFVIEAFAGGSGGDSHADSEIGGGVGEAEATDDVDEDVFVGEAEFGAFFEDGDEEIEAVEVKAGGGALRVAEDGLADEGLDLDEEGAGAFDAAKDDGAVDVLALGEEGGGGVFDFLEAELAHFKDSDFVGAAEAVFDGADGFEAAVAVAFEV